MNLFLIHSLVPFTQNVCLSTSRNINSKKLLELNRKNTEYPSWRKMKLLKLFHVIKKGSDNYVAFVDFYQYLRKSNPTLRTFRDVDHLKTSKNYLNEVTLNKEIVTQTETGKRAISLYLAEHLHSLSFDKDVQVIVDSELHMDKPCSSSKEYCIPIIYSFKSQSITDKTCATQLPDINQCKGEAEMAVADWLIHCQDDLQVGDDAVCIVTSGDIDAIYIHLFAICRFWKRNGSGKFSSQVYVVLQKPQGKHDIYNITALLELFEETFNDKNIGCKIAIALCIGGNDFIPKTYQLSHDTILKKMVDSLYYRNNLFSFADEKVQLNFECFTDFYKSLFCPKRLSASNLTYEEVRAVTIGKLPDENKGTFKTSDPRKWLPPRSAILKLCGLIQLQIEYVCTAGKHSAPLPDFLGSNCLKKNSCGEIEYDFGPESHFSSLLELPEVQMKVKQKRRLENTPQSGARRKRPLTSTPKRA